jgi:hypothetical protein
VDPLVEPPYARLVTRDPVSVSCFFTKTKFSHLLRDRWRARDAGAAAGRTAYCSTSERHGLVER